MSEANVQLRIRVIVVSTRAALRSLAPDDPQVARVIERGRDLLGALESESADGSQTTRRVFDDARGEIDQLETGDP